MRGLLAGMEAGPSWLEDKFYPRSFRLAKPLKAASRFLQLINMDGSVPDRDGIRMNDIIRPSLGLVEVTREVFSLEDPLDSWIETVLVETGDAMLVRGWRKNGMLEVKRGIGAARAKPIPAGTEVVILGSQ